jgi:hypothetical protein
MTRVYLHVGAGLWPNALAFQDLDAAWRDALVKELLEYKAAALACAKAIRARIRAEARFFAKSGHPQSAKTHHKARALRAWRRNAERMARHWQIL